MTRTRGGIHLGDRNKIGRAFRFAALTTHISLQIKLPVCARSSADPRFNNTDILNRNIDQRRNNSPNMERNLCAGTDYQTIVFISQLMTICGSKEFAELAVYGILFRRPNQDSAKSFSKSRNSHRSHTLYYGSHPRHRCNPVHHG